MTIELKNRLADYKMLKRSPFPYTLTYWLLGRQVTITNVK